MAISLYVSLLLVALLTITTQETPTLSPSPSTPVTPPPLATAPPPPAIALAPPPPPTTADMQASQLKNIIDALIGAGDFGGWVNALSSVDPSAFPLSATFFIPNDDASAHTAAATGGGVSFDPLLIPYHIVPQRLTFSDLQQFATHSHLPTLLPSKYIVITNNSAANFTVDDSQIIQPDMFLNGCFSVQGINNILDYSLHGGGHVGLLSPPPGNTNPESPNPTTLEPPPPPRKKKNPDFPGFTIAVISTASCSSSGVLIILSTLLAVIFIQDSL